MFSSRRAVSAALVAATLLIASCGSDDGGSAVTVAPTTVTQATVTDTTPDSTPGTTEGTTEGTIDDQTENTTASTDAPAQDIDADTAGAETALLTLADFPEGWSETPVEDGATSEIDGRLAECVGVDSLTSSEAQATTAAFTNPDGNLVAYEGVGTLAADLDARTVIGRVTNPDVLDCFAAAYAELGATALSAGAIAEGAEIGEVAASRLAVASAGDATQAIRVVIPVTADGTTTQLTVDRVLVRSGRSIAVVTFEGRVDEGTAVETIDEIVAVAASRLPS